jgi:hypothetical protein
MIVVELAALTSGFAIGVVAATVGVVAALMRLLQYLDAAAADDDGDEGSGGGGGSGVRGGTGRGPDRPSPGGREPEWWPEFESEFAEYAARRDAAR